MVDVGAHSVKALRITFRVLYDGGSRTSDGRVDDGRGSDGSSTGVLAVPASRVSRDWCCPDGELVLGGGPGSGVEWVGVTAGDEIAGPGIETGRLVKVAVTTDDRLEAGRVPTEGGGSISNTLGERERTT